MCKTNGSLILIALCFTINVRIGHSFLVIIVMTSDTYVHTFMYTCIHNVQLVPSYIFTSN